MASHDPFSTHRTMPVRGARDPMPGAPGSGVPFPGAHRADGPRSAVSRSGGADGNERLTAAAGAVLLVLLAAEGFTILGLRQLITAHFFIGMMLLGPVTLKLFSTVYRFTRYYTGSAPYRRKGPPVPLLRLLGPVVVAATVGVFGSGVGLALSGPGGNSALWLFLHKGSFIVWFGAMSIHVLYYFWRIPGLIGADLRGRPASSPAGHSGQAFGGGQGGSVYGGQAAYGGQGYGGQGYGGFDRSPVGARYERAVEILGGRGLRLTLLVASLLAGLVIAALTVHLSGPWHFIQYH